MTSLTSCSTTAQFINQRSGLNIPPFYLSFYLPWWNQDVKQIGKFSPETTHFVMRVDSRWERERERSRGKKSHVPRSVRQVYRVKLRVARALEWPIVKRSRWVTKKWEKSLERGWFRNVLRPSDKNCWYTGQETFEKRGIPCMPGSWYRLKYHFITDKWLDLIDLLNFFQSFDRWILVATRLHID